MRVLLVAGSPEPSASALVARLAAGSDLVIAVDRGIEPLRAAGIVPDAFCGDADTASASSLAWAEDASAPVRIFPPAKDDTDLSLAFRCVRELAGLGVEARTTSGGVEQGVVAHGELVPRGSGRPSVTVTCASGGRPDHALAVYGVLADNADLSPRLVEDGFECRVLSPAGTASWELGEAAVGREFSFVALADATVASERGMRWELDHFRVDALRDRGISNVVDEPCAAVRCDGGVLAAFLLPAR